MAFAGCSSEMSTSQEQGSDSVDAAIEMTPVDAADPAASPLGAVSDVVDLTSCPAGAPQGASCKRITVRGCLGIENETVQATVAVLAPTSAIKGTITHFSGGGGGGFHGAGTSSYQAAGFRQVYVAWESDWESTAASGIKAAACRPATVLKWIFEQPSLHAGSRTSAFCGEGFSGGSAQLGYALATYGLGDILDYVNELSGPPFARIDLGCDGSAPETAMMCGATVTMQLPPERMSAWENAPSCGSANVSASELLRWKNDSILIGGVYDYPNTRIEFFDCTHQATAVTAMSKLAYDQIVAAEGGTSRAAHHCYSQADGCSGEALGSGAQDAVQAMLNGCIPRHP